MDFRLTEEQEMIAETVGSALADLCGSQELRRMIDAGEIFQRERWGALAGLGLCGVLLPERAGGLGLTEVEFAGVAERCGYALLPEPLVESAGVALPLLAEIGPPEFADDVAAMAAGEGYAVFFHPAQPLAAHAEAARLVIAADEEGAVAIGRPADIGLTRQQAADPLAPVFTASPGPKARRLPATEEIRAAVARAADRGALFAACQMAGVAQAATDLSVAYAKERRQFGRPIGANQAIKHMLAEAQVGIEFLRPVLLAAAAMASRGDALSRAHVSHARLRAAEVVDRATRAAVQTHGAMGYSWETDVHLHLKHGLVLSSAWGRADRHLERVAGRALGARGELERLF